MLRQNAYNTEEFKINKTKAEKYKQFCFTFSHKNERELAYHFYISFCLVIGE